MGYGDTILPRFLLNHVEAESVGQKTYYKRDRLIIIN